MLPTQRRLLLGGAARLAATTRRQFSSVPASTASVPEYDPKNPLAHFLRHQGVVIADGAGTLRDEDHPLRGANLLFGKAGHDATTAMHRGFLEAGADLISSASYGASFEAFQSAGAFFSLPGGAITKPELQQRFTKNVLRASVELAKRAAVEFWRDEDNRTPGRLRPIVAASVGPVAWNLSAHDCADDAAVSLHYQRKLAAIALSKPDLVALRTISGIREASLALGALAEVAPSLPATLTFLCRAGAEGRTSAGDELGEACARAAEMSPQLVACGLQGGLHGASANELQPALHTARRRLADCVALIAQPDLGWSGPKSEAAAAMTRGASAGPHCCHGEPGAELITGARAVEMRAWGADVVGGCCWVTPSQVRGLRGALLGHASSVA